MEIIILPKSGFHLSQWRDLISALIEKYPHGILVPHETISSTTLSLQVEKPMGLDDLEFMRSLRHLIDGWHGENGSIFDNLL